MTPPHSHVQSAESTLILVAFSLCSLCPLASVPWPGCSLIHHQNMKSIVSPSGVGRGGRGRVPEADLVPGEGGPPSTRRRVPGRRSARARAHAHGGRHVSQVFLVLLHGEEVTTETQRAPLPLWPFPRHAAPHLGTLYRKRRRPWQGDKGGDVWGALSLARGMLDRGRLLLSRSDKHNENSVSRPCLLC